MLQNPFIFAARLCKQVARLSTPVFYYMDIYHITLLMNIKTVPRTSGQHDAVGKHGSLWKKLYHVNINQRRARVAT